MPSRQRFSPALVAAFVVALSGVAPTVSLAAPDEAVPTIYRWIDADGIVHYTTDPRRIPAALRGRIAAPGSEPAATVTPSETLDPISTSVSRRSGDLWAERDRPPEAETGENGEFIGGSGFTVDDPARTARIEELDGQIDALLETIAVDEEALKQRVVGPDADPANSGADAELREISRRLPTLLSELRALRAERERLEPPLEER